MGAGLIYAIGFAIVVTVIGLCFKILPTSPFLAYIGVSDFGQYLPYINYFIPIDFFICATEAWLMALTAYIVLKFSRKAISFVSDIMPLQ